MGRTDSLSVARDIYVVGGADLSHPYDCLVYLVDGGEEMVLIDTGAGEGYELIVDNIRSLVLRPERLKAVIATHSHIDHIGALCRFREEFGAQVIAHELDADAIETGVGCGAEYYGLGYRPCKVDVVLRGSDGVVRCGRHELKVIHIPGHTPGSVAVYLDAEKRVLFGQDVHGPYFIKGANTEQAKVSLRRLMDLQA